MLDLIHLDYYTNNNPIRLVMLKYKEINYVKIKRFFGSCRYK